MGVADYRLNPDGPHSDDYTRHVAQALAESIRVLNHATRGPDGITYPGTVYDVLGSLNTAVDGLDQLLRQLYQKLNNMHAAGELGDDSGHPARELHATKTALTLSRETTRRLSAHLRFAHQTTSGMHLLEGGDA